MFLELLVTFLVPFITLLPLILITLGFTYSSSYPTHVDLEIINFAIEQQTVESQSNKPTLSVKEQVSKELQTFIRLEFEKYNEYYQKEA